MRRSPDREPPPADLAELGAAELGAAVRAYVQGGPRDDDAVQEMCRLKDELGRNGVRFLAARVDGEVAGWCEMRRYQAGGQVEDLVVLEPFRGRGLARAPRVRSGRSSAERRLRSGLRVADDKDTVKDLYHRLGFDAVRRTWSFWWPGLK